MAIVEAYGVMGLGLTKATMKVCSLPLWAATSKARAERGGEGGVTNESADSLPPSLTLPHKGGGNAPAKTATVLHRGSAEPNFIEL